MKAEKSVEEVELVVMESEEKGFMEKSSFGVMEAVTETHNEGSQTTVVEEFMSSGKRRKISNDSSSSENNFIASSLEMKSIDRKRKNSEIEVSKFSDGEFSGETSRSRELSGGNPGEVATESSSSATEKEASPQKDRDAGAPPTAEEIDEFFSAAEKYEQKRFTEKYNYDVVKDIPLEGRYQWIRM